MAVEVYSNNASTTVASGGYTPASGVLNVASTASPFLSVSTGVTQMHLLVYRIIGGLITPIVNFVATNTVSATQWAVTAEGSDNAALVGDIVICVLSSAGMNQIRADVSQSGTRANLPATTNQKLGNRYKCTDAPYEFIYNGTSWDCYCFGYQVVEPVLANFTTILSPVTNTSHGGIIFSGAYGGASQAIGIVVPSTPYNIDCAFTTIGFGSAATANGAVGVGAIASLSSTAAAAWMQNGTTGSVQSNISVSKVTNLTTAAGFSSNGTGIMSVFGGPLIWNRISDDGTNRKYWISANGYDWVLVYSEGRTVGFTTGDAMFFVTPYQQNITCHLLHWNIH